MSDKKHIDRIFQEKLKDFEATPNEAVWDNINNQLKKGKDDRKVIPIWWKLAGVAAALLVLLTIGNLMYNNSDNVHPIVVDTENIDSDNKNADENTSTVIDNGNLEDTITESYNKTSTKYNEIIQSEISNKNYSVTNFDESNTNKNQTKSKSESKKINTKKPSNTNSYLVNSQTNQAPKINRNSNEESSFAINKSNENISLNQEAKKEALVENKTDESNVIEKNRLLDLIGNIKEKELIINNEKEEIPLTDDVLIGNKDNKEEQLVVDEEKGKISLTEDVIVNNEDINEEERLLNRWQINPNVAPVYFSSFGKGSPIHEQLINNKKSGTINMSYGVNVSYAVNDKLSVKSGINRVNLGYSTNDIIIYENVGVNSSSNSYLFRNIKLNESSTHLSFVSGDSFSFVQSPSIIPNESMAFLNQEMTYYEIPLEVKYKLSEKKIGFSIVGGFSTFILSDNKVSYELRGVSTELGEATNINNTSFSANIGLGLDYNIFKNINLNLDPMFKYQINTFNNTSGSFKPYFIGVYSGINIKF